MHTYRTLYYPIVTKYNIDVPLLEDFHDLLYAGATSNYEGEISDNYIYSILPEDLGEIYDYYNSKFDYFNENGLDNFEKELEFINKLVSKNNIDRIIIKLTNDQREVYSITK